MTTPAPPQTILDAKLSFLTAQIRALSAPISIPSSYVPRNDDDALRQRSIDQALRVLNERIRAHATRVYSRIAIRHVAEQVDGIYWRVGMEEGDGGGEEPGEGREGGLMKGCDFGLSEVIQKLPDTWDDDEDEEQNGNGEAKARYAELAERLRNLNARREELKQKVEGYRALKDKLEVLEDAKESVQENLVGREGVLEKEIERMRVLVGRLRGRVEGLEENERSGDGDVIGDVDDEVWDQRKALEVVMGGV